MSVFNGHTSILSYIVITLRKSHEYYKNSHVKITRYYKNFLPLKLPSPSITFGLILSNKLCSFVALYRSPSQSQDDFATFSDNFEMTLDLVSKKNPYLLVVLGDFNAKLKQWYDKDSSTSEGISIENITSQFGLHQIINEPTLRNLICQLNQELSPHSTELSLSDYLHQI